MYGYDNDSNRRNYEGLWAWKPNRTEDHWWGTRETHDRYFGPPVPVEKHIWGTVTKVDRSWL